MFLKQDIMAIFTLSLHCFMDFNVSFIDRFDLFACFMAAAEIEKICNFFPTPPDSCLIFELPHCHML